MIRDRTSRLVAGPYAPAPVCRVTEISRCDDRNDPSSYPVQITSSPTSCRSGNWCSVCRVCAVTPVLSVVSPVAARSRMAGAYSPSSLPPIPRSSQISRVMP